MNGNFKVKAIMDETVAFTATTRFTKGKVYEFIDGTGYFDNGIVTFRKYGSFKELIKSNPDCKHVLIEEKGEVQ